MKSKGKLQYAHSIKNPHIKHWYRIEGDRYPYDGKKHRRYLCCIWYTPEKIAKTKAEVTCKTCLKLLGGTRMTGDSQRRR